jgi:hypothetical protein
LFAGEIQFSGRGRRGQLIWWNNASGHYLPTPEWSHQAGLPLDLYRNFDSGS